MAKIQMTTVAGTPAGVFRQRGKLPAAINQPRTFTLHVVCDVMPAPVQFRLLVGNYSEPERAHEHEKLSGEMTESNGKLQVYFEVSDFYVQNVWIELESNSTPVNLHVDLKDY
jgi:hypothetical protein